MELWITAIGSFAALVLCAWRGSAPLLTRLKNFIHRVASSPAKTTLLLFIIAAVVYPLPSLLYRVPTPVIHDEFGYLLQADTFAHGRMANEPHPMREFFETFHILQQPTYAAKFPPGLGMALALGIKLGLPLIGNWILLFAGACAVFWMIRAVVPSRWALLIAILASVHPTVLWFSQIYWGGAVALLGGALLAGAVLRGIKQPDAQNGLIAGVGMSFLMVGRPFEDALLSVACAFALLALASRRLVRPLLLQFTTSALATLATSGSALMYYNWRVTEHPTLLPYVLHTKQYMAAPLFYWQNVPPQPSYPNDQIRQFHTGLEFDEYSKFLYGWAYFIGMIDRAGIVIWAYLRTFLLVVPLIVAVFWKRGRAVLTALFVCVAVLAAHVTISPWMRPAYMSPLMGMLLIPVGIGLRHLYVWRLHNQPIGRVLVRAIVITQLIAGGYELIRNATANAHVVIAQRAEIIQSLEKQGGQHLVLVQYTPDNKHEQEWVYNGADVDASPVIFARDLGAERDQKLLAYYHNRKIWTIKVSPREATFSPYNPADESSPAHLAPGIAVLTSRAK